MKLFSFTFKYIKPSPILLFDGYRTTIFKKHVLNGFTYQTVEFRVKFKEHRTIWLSEKSLIYSLIYLLSKYSWKYSFKVNLLFSYLFGAVKTFNPNVVISFYGVYSQIFGIMANLLPKTSFIGSCPAQFRNRILNYIVPSNVHYYVFGNYDMKQLMKIGQCEDTIHIVGSLYSGIYLDNYRKRKENVYDICLLSNVNDRWFNNQKENEDTIAEYLNRFILDGRKKLKLVIAFRPQPNDFGTQREYNYYTVNYSELEFDIIRQENVFSSYQAISSSSVIIANSSTLAFEALGWGKKILFVQPYIFHNDIPEEIRYKVIKPDYKIFSSFLRELLSISQEDYIKNIEPSMHEFNHLNWNKYPQFILADKINSLI